MTDIEPSIATWLLVLLECIGKCCHSNVMVDTGLQCELDRSSCMWEMALTLSIYLMNLDDPNCGHLGYAWNLISLEFCVMLGVQIAHYSWNLTSEESWISCTCGLGSQCWWKKITDEVFDVRWHWPDVMAWLHLWKKQFFLCFTRNRNWFWNSGFWIHCLIVIVIQAIHHEQRMIMKMKMFVLDDMNRTAFAIWSPQLMRWMVDAWSEDWEQDLIAM